MSEMTNITTEASDSPVSNKTVLRLDDVRKSFGNTQVLRGISFDIHQHEVVALLGPSGSGKSTLMKCVNLLEQVDDLRNRRLNRAALNLAERPFTT